MEMQESPRRQRDLIARSGELTRGGHVASRFLIHTRNSVGPLEYLATTGGRVGGIFVVGTERIHSVPDPDSAAVLPT